MTGHQGDSSITNPYPRTSSPILSWTSSKSETKGQLGWMHYFQSIISPSLPQTFCCCKVMIMDLCLQHLYSIASQCKFEGENTLVYPSNSYKHKLSHISLRGVTISDVNLEYCKCLDISHYLSCNKCNPPKISCISWYSCCLTVPEIRIQF